MLDSYNQMNSNSDEGLSIYQAIIFLQDTWKKLFISILIGAVLGLSFHWLFWVKYSGQIVLVNSQNNYGIDTIEWKKLQKSLPSLATEIIDKGTLSEIDANFYREMSNEEWWKKNAIPNYAFNKSDSKEIPGLYKDFETALNPIISINLSANGSSKEAALSHLESAVKLLLNGGAYLELRNLFQGYDAKTINLAATLQQKINKNQKEIYYLADRAKKLQELRNLYPNELQGTSSSKNSSQNGDLDRHAFLISQIVAVNTEIIQLKEDINRMHVRIDEVKYIKRYLDQAQPLLASSFDGLALCKSLLEIETKLRAEEVDENDRFFLDEVRSQIIDVEVRFTKGLQATTPAATKSLSSFYKSMLIGLATTFLLTLIVLLSLRIWMIGRNSESSLNR